LFDDRFSTMTIEWVNHASFLVKEGPVCLLIDPWLIGLAFDYSWALLSPTGFSSADFERVTHIWFSHEHPDHFSPSSLKIIPSAIRHRITVLFQHTEDKRLITFCRNLGFRDVRELSAEWIDLSQDLRVFCQPVSRGDSWLAIKSKDGSILNLNDCIYMSESSLDPVKNIAGAVDVLITQFSYASWWGNETDTERWKAAAQGALDKVVREIRVLKPLRVIPAASFVYFCHEENEYMNRHINRVDRAFEVIRCTGTEALVMYPGDEWSIGEPWNSQPAITRYLADYERAESSPVKVRAEKVDIEKLVQRAAGFLRTLRRHNSRLLLRRMPVVKIYLTDHKRAFAFGLKGLREIPDCSASAADIALSSSALLYCLRFPWGGETLMVNGRFHSPEGGNRQAFFRWFSIAQANSRCTYYNRAYYVRKLRNKFNKLGRLAGHPAKDVLS